MTGVMEIERDFRDGVYTALATEVISWVATAGGCLPPDGAREASMNRAGMTNKGIADALTISRRTVDGHVERILRKLDFSSRTQVASWVASVAGQPAARPDSGRTVST